MSTPMSLSMQGVRELISLYILFYLCITLIQTCLLPNINILKDGAHGVILCLQKGLIDWLINWVLMPLSAVFQLYHGDQFLVVEEAGVPGERTTDHGQATGKLYHLLLRVECTLLVIYKAGREHTLYWW